MKRTKKRWKAIPKLTIFEKRNALGVQECMKANMNPLAICVQSSGGEVRYTYKDIANLYELTGRKFDAVTSNFILTEGKRGYERKVDQTSL